MPVSVTENSISTRLAFLLFNFTLIDIDPAFVNFSALLMRFVNIWVKRRESPKTWLGISESILIEKFNFFSFKDHKKLF